MDSTLLDQIRHLCRDRAAYEHLKAILVQQERVLQLSWEERYAKLMAEQASDTQASNIFSNILAREKALAQLADAIQRSPSLELVLQVAVQVAQKVLQVDRVAIFRRHPDGRGEFVTDAIASGLVSIAGMPERQLLLSKHMIESMQTEQSAQTVDNIRISSLSSHLVTLLEQIGISTYAANKIYAGHEAWGILVAFHGSVYHIWSESDRTSLSLLAAQIGIAISLANLRQQSQTLTDDLQNLQIELDSLQKVVSEIISNESKTKSNPLESNNPDVNDIADPFITMFPQEIVPQESAPQDLDEEASQALDAEISESEPELQTQEIDEESADSEYVPISQGAISQNGLPRLFLIPEISTSSNLDNQDFEDVNEDDCIVISEEDAEDSAKNISNIVDSEEELITEPDDLEIDRDPVPVTIDADDLPVITAIASESEESEPREIEIENITENITAIESELEITEPELERIELEIVEPEPEITEPELERIELEIVESELEIVESEPEIILLDASKVEDFDTQIGDPEVLIESQPLELEESDLDADETDEEDEQEAIALEPSQDDLESPTFELSDDDREPAIEPQFIETILSIASHEGNGVRFLLNVIDTYLEETPLLVQSIDRAIAVDDHPQVLQILNTLRSSSDYIGALALSSQCRQLESAVRSNDTVLIHDCLSQVVIEAQRATEALRIERSHYI